MRLYVGNLSYDTTDAALSQAFGNYGEVSSVQTINDRQTGKSKGFAFVEMPDAAAAQAAIEALNNTMLDGRTIVVNEAKPMQPREQRQGGFGGGNRGGYGRRDY